MRYKKLTVALALFGVCTEAVAQSDATQIHLHVGPNRVVAGEGAIMVVAEVLTENGQNVDDGYRLAMAIRCPDQFSNSTHTTQNGVAVFFAPAGERSGDCIISVSNKNFYQSQTIRVVPGNAADFDFRELGCSPTGDCRVETSKIKDRFGNPLPDGTLATLSVWRSSKLIYQKQVFSINGAISTNWRHPEAQNAQVALSVSGITRTGVVK